MGGGGERGAPLPDAQMPLLPRGSSRLQPWAPAATSVLGKRPGAMEAQGVFWGFPQARDFQVSAPSALSWIPQGVAMSGSIQEALLKVQIKRDQDCLLTSESIYLARWV